MAGQCDSHGLGDGGVLLTNLHKMHIHESSPQRAHTTESDNDQVS
jgi:hypothetical protein